MRQTWEEIGIDLAEKDFMLIGRLDDREITTSLGKRLLMILSPYGRGFHGAVMSHLIYSYSSVFASVAIHTSTRPNSWYSSALDSHLFPSCVNEDEASFERRVRHSEVDDRHC